MEERYTTVKSINAEEGRVGGYLVVWGDASTRDLQGEYFTPETDLALDWYEARPVLYHHGLDGNLKAAVIGRIEHLHVDDVGIWAEAQLDMHKRYVRTVQRLIEKGVLHWSSGSLAHLVEVGTDGHIKRWPLVEGSLTPTPAEPRRTDVQSLKSAYEALGLNFTAPPISSEGENVTGEDMRDKTPPPTAPRIQGGETNHSTEKGIKSMQPTQDMAHKQLPLASQQEAVKRITVSSEFDTLDALDMLHGYMLLRAGKSFQGVSERYSNALSHKINQAGLAAIKADELSYSTQTGFGDEWVPEMWSAQIWQKARQDNTILPLIQSIEMGITLEW